MVNPDHKCETNQRRLDKCSEQKGPLQICDRCGYLLIEKQYLSLNGKITKENINYDFRREVYTI